MRTLHKNRIERRKILNIGAKKSYAVIDIGTNSTRMLIYRRHEDGTLFRINKSVKNTRMGQDVNKTKKLHKDAIARNLAALQDYIEMGKEYHVVDYYIFGTSAMRDATNTDTFLKKAKETLNLDISVVSGTTEAAFGFLGVAQCFKEPLLIFDIGGGSTELIDGHTQKIHKIYSMNIGCVRMTEQFIHHDPPLTQEIHQLNQFIDQEITKAFIAMNLKKPFDDKRLVGIGGTATSVSTIAQQLEGYDSEKVHLSVISKSQLEGILEQLVSLPLEKRKAIVGLEEKRADIIIAGICILLKILERTEATEYTVCDYDNLEGAAFRRHFEKKLKN